MFEIVIGVLGIVAAAVYVGGKADSLEDAVSAAQSALDSGAALDALERLKDATNR